MADLIRKIRIFLFIILLFICVIANADRYDDDTTLDYSWEPASGSVSYYNVYVSIDGGAFEMVDITDTSSYTLTGAKVGATYRLKVQAVDAAENTGPFSDESDPTTVIGLFGDVAPVPGTEGRQQGDGKVDVGDALRIAEISVQLISATSVDIILGDIAPSPGTPDGPNDGRFGDGNLNVGDASRIARYAVELIDEQDFPAARVTQAPSIKIDAYADIKQPQVIVENTVVYQNETVNVNIRLVNQTSTGSVGAIQFTLDYDEQRWSIPKNPIKGTLLKDGAILTTNPQSFPSNSGNLIVNAFTVAKYGFYQEDEDLLLTVPFQASANALPKEIAIKLEINIATDIYGNDILIPSKGRKIRIPIIELPTSTALLQNYPNPFNPETWIPFQIAKEADVTIHIYDIIGRLVLTLDLGRKQAGFYFAKEQAAHWQGRNQNGEQVANGMYFYTIQAGQFTAIKRMVVVK
jgi:flagellar hook assembly protein FlgD